MGGKASDQQTGSFLQAITIVREGLSAEHLLCRACGLASSQAFVIALVPAGTKEPWLRYYRCSHCGSITGAGEVGEKGHRPSPHDAMAPALAEKAAVEFFCSFGRQMYGMRSFANCEPRRMLDVGCGLGVGPDCARTLFSAEAYGYDPGPEAAMASQSLGFPLIAEYFDPDAPGVEGPFDLIQAWELIEHLERPRETVSAFRDLLADTGLLLLSTPVADALTPDADDATILYLLAPPSHLHLFSERALTDLLRACGFAYVDSELIGAQTTVAASQRPIARRTKEESWAIYADYLDARVEGLANDNPFKTGFQGRRLLHELGTGHWDRAREISEWFDEDLQARWGVTLPDREAPWREIIAGEPDPAAFCRLPTALSLLLMVKGRLAQRDARNGEALVWFDLARQAGRFTIDSLAMVGLLDAQLPNLTKAAERAFTQLQESNIA